MYVFFDPRAVGRGRVRIPAGDGFECCAGAKDSYPAPLFRDGAGELPSPEKPSYPGEAKAKVACRSSVMAKPQTHHVPDQRRGVG